MAQAETARTPRQRWGTCCPFDPECEHSYLDIDDLWKWMDGPLTDAEAQMIEHAFTLSHEAVAGPGHVVDVPVSASEPNPPKAGRHRAIPGR